MAALLVAVVDDEEPVRKALGRLLRASGLVAECFPSGHAFLGSLTSAQPDCVILDLHMPGLGGLQVLQRLRERQPPLPTIVITGHDEPENQSRCMSLGAIAYMRKPIDDHALLQTIEQAVQKRTKGSSP
jgi:FixJ family two-component response regulator